VEEETARSFCPCAGDSPPSNPFRRLYETPSSPLSCMDPTKLLGLNEVPNGESWFLSGILGTGGLAMPIPIGRVEGEALAEVAPA
jgi:hypothetical protein